MFDKVSMISRSIQSWFFCCFDVVHPLHNFLQETIHIISVKSQSVYYLLYYTKQVCNKVSMISRVFCYFNVVHSLNYIE